MGPGQGLVKNRALSKCLCSEIAMSDKTFAPSDTEKTWRREWDSNPRAPCGATRFRGELFRPLRHLSAVDIVGYYERRARKKSLNILAHSSRKTPEVISGV